MAVDCIRYLFNRSECACYVFSYSLKLVWFACVSTTTTTKTTKNERKIKAITFVEYFLLLLAFDLHFTNSLMFFWLPSSCSVLMCFYSSKYTRTNTQHIDTMQNNNILRKRGAINGQYRESVESKYRTVYDFQ